MPRGGTLSSLGSSFEELIQGANQAREATAELRGELNNVQRETTRNAQMISAVIDTLTGNMTGIRQEIEKVVAGINNLSSATAQNRHAVERETATIDDLWEAYKKMGVEVDELNLNLKTLTFTEKEINKVVQLGTAYNRQREDSYTALSEKYRAVKILIDNMTIAERENTAEGRAFVAMARDMYEQMNLLQQRTGKYQLQVGDYSKAMTGLNIATNQVVRELPVLANGVSMFAIAISNNIPILVDNIMQVKRSNEAYAAQRAELLKNAAAFEAAGDAAAAAAARESAAGIKTTSVVSALGKAFFSWQTAIVLVLTVLPGLIRNIEKKKKAQEEANKATKDAIEYEEILAEAYKERDKEQVKDTTRLEVLYSITQDLTRAQEDRIKAARIMKQEYEDEFANLSEAEIVLGKAKDAYDRLTESLVTQAKARAYLNKITALQEQIIDQQAIADQAKATKEAADAEVARWNAALNAQIELGNTGEGLSYFSQQLDKATRKQQEATSAFMQADMPIQDLDNAILKLEKDIPVDGLLAEILKGRGRGGKEGMDKLPDYFWDVLKSSAEALESTLDRDLAILEAGWLKTQNAYLQNLNKLNEMREKANAQEREAINQQTEYILFLMRDGQAKFEAEQRRIINERINSYAEVVDEEEDFDQKRIDAIARNLHEEQVLRTQAAYQIFELSNRTAEDKENLDQALRDSERQYWQDYLDDLRDAGLLTIQEYNRIMAQLAKVTKDGEARMSRGRKGRRYGGIAEALLAQTETFGEKNKFGINIVKEEYQDFVISIDNALKTSMKYMDEWMDKRLEMAKIAVEAAEKEVAAAQKVLDYEMEARANGYANQVETARKELDLEREQHRKALEEQRRLQSQQLILDSMSQTSSLITATANIWESMTKTGPLGPALAIAATALMWGSFAASKLKAAQLSKMQSEQYGEGTVELLEGGSHASGHDIDMGVKKDGTRRRAEGGEFFAIINKRNSRRYRGVIPDVIKSFNDGTFGEKYYSANQAMGDFALGLLAGNSPTDVSKLEKDVRAIRQQGDEHRYVDSMGNTVIRYKNLTRKIKI